MLSFYLRYCSILGAFLVIFLLPHGVASQTLASTPQAAATPGDSDAPKFGIVAIGDYPNGFFEDVTVSPGETVVLEVAVMNVGNVQAELTTYKVNAMNSVNGGFMAGDPDEEPVGAAAWIDYPTEELSVSPGEQHEIEFSVTVPEDTKPGQYIAGLMVQTTESHAIPGTDVFDQVLGYAISVGILVPGDLNREFELGVPSIEGFTLSVPLRNTGNYLVRPEGRMELVNAEGEPVFVDEVTMGSIYGGLETSLTVILPDQIPAGDYTLNILLSDPQSGADGTIEGASLTIDEPQDPSGISVVHSSIEPNSEDIVFAGVDVTLNNGGQQIPASNVTLEVMRDGEQVDSFPLATNQVLLNGENQFVTRYLPADMWKSGEYTFSIKVSAVDPNGGQETVLLDEELDATIEVP